MKKQQTKTLWETLQPLGGSKQDTYVQVLRAGSMTPEDALQESDYARVREIHEMGGGHTWLQNKQERENQLLCASHGIDSGGFGLPYRADDFEIVWKDGKPV